MKDLKLELFNFKNSLTIDQLDVSRVVQTCLENYDYISEKEILEGLKNDLSNYTYFKEVKQLFENIEEEIESKPLVYEMKDLYKKVERKNLGMLYRQPLVTLLEIINRVDDDARMEGILNELTIYDWVPEIKHFLMKMTQSPIERQNLRNAGKASKVYTIVEKCEEGHLTFNMDKWFLIGESEIKQVFVDDYIKDNDKIRDIRLLEKVMSLSEIKDNRLLFPIDENLELGISIDKKEIYLNGEKLDKETTLETLFNSPIIPMLRRDYYPVIESAINNLDKFMELDIVLRVTNLLNPFNESLVYNYKDKIYVYSKDARTGSRFYAYENANELIHDIQQEYQCDLSSFFEKKLSTEVKALRTLEDREQQINIKLQDVKESIDMLKDNEDLIKENKELEETFNNLLAYKHNLTIELNDIKDKKSTLRRTFIK
ncbi:hypothetical protein M0Q50_02950 [bacterium]|jgi:hypothetical protein|nr:hypothetical protein [bacterium]